MGDHVVSENVYEALGFSDHKAMATKAGLAMRIADQIKARGLSGIQAAKVMGLTQPKLSGLLRGQFQSISERKMMDCLTALGTGVRPRLSDTTRP